jgi:hypothetical protein
MPDTLIEDPILNSPYPEPTRHFRFYDEGITNEIVETQRVSAYFVPILPPKKKGKIWGFKWTDRTISGPAVRLPHGRIIGVGIPGARGSRFASATSPNASDGSLPASS